ncbi:MAG: peptide chain release factor 2 [Actinobacteria bacterium]|nr:peptide chain release factor 2 [Actinomycetota bacterium]
MADLERTQRLSELDSTLSSILSVQDPEAIARELAELEQQAAEPSLWDDQARAQQVTSRLSFLQGEQRRLAELKQEIEDVGVLMELAESESDADTWREVDDQLDTLTTAIKDLEVHTLLSGEFDQRSALVHIHSGAGGVDAADWAQMLLRMYSRYCERLGWPYQILDTSYAEEAGIKSATIEIDAPYAFGTLSVEQGTHRLVRISPFDNQSRRQTSFARVEVLPVTEQTDHIDIPETDIRIDVFRSSGPGGQSVNTTDSAVRITHLPSGIVVSCQNEKSQIQNRAAAMRVLQSRLLELQRQQEQEALDALKGDASGSWGDQMRSYVLHPYQMVKDLRTGTETGNTSNVLDGDIDEFIESGIRWRRESEKQSA